MSRNERRLRITLMPEPPLPLGLASSAFWPRFDVIDPPPWLAELGGKEFSREGFEWARKRLGAEGYATSKTPHGITVMRIERQRKGQRISPEGDHAGPKAPHSPKPKVA